MMNTGAIVSLGLLGLIFGAVLALAAKKLAVKTDPREASVLEALPGANCGACGYPGCAGFASAIVAGKAPVSACPVGGAQVAARIGEIMGLAVDTSAMTRRVAYVKCLGDNEACPAKFTYDGEPNCRAALLVGGGPKLCSFGCLGLGSCVAACQFGAMQMSDRGLPVVDPVKCTACGKCVDACPRHLIELLDEDIAVCVACCSTAKGADVRKTCKVGCIGCGLCAKNCPAGAITVTDSLARIDQAKCTRCGICAEKCPPKCIVVQPDHVRVVETSSSDTAASSNA